MKIHYDAMNLRSVEKNQNYFQKSCIQIYIKHTKIILNFEQTKIHLRISHKTHNYNKLNTLFIANE